MTSLIAWTGADTRGPSSIYLASDSRISWPGYGVWNYGRKVFFCKKRPELFGYAGDVLFPSLVLGQIADSIDQGVLFSESENPDSRFRAIKNYIHLSFSGLPKQAQQPFSILYVTREGSNMTARFFLWKLDWNQGKWREERIDIPGISSSLDILGSGEGEVKKWHSRWQASTQGGTSRAIFSGFYDAVKSGKDPNSGGVVQLVRLYRINPGQGVGIIENKKPFLFGMPVPGIDHETLHDIEWRNSKFERCDVHGNLIENAQPHHVPQGLGSD